MGVKPRPRRLPVIGDARPRTRAECVDAPRPCPFVGCRYHLALDVVYKSIRVNVGRSGRDGQRPRSKALLKAADVFDADQVVDELVAWWFDGAPSCALDEAEIGAANRDEVGDAMAIAHSFVHRIEASAMAKIAGSLDGIRLLAAVNGDDDGQ